MFIPVVSSVAFALTFGVLLSYAGVLPEPRARELASIAVHDKSSPDVRELLERAEAQAQAPLIGYELGWEEREELGSWPVVYAKVSDGRTCLATKFGRACNKSAAP